MTLTFIFEKTYYISLHLEKLEKEANIFGESNITINNDSWLYIGNNKYADILLTKKLFHEIDVVTTIKQNIVLFWMVIESTVVWYPCVSFTSLTNHAT